jgi:hypothetical protein
MNLTQRGENSMRSTDEGMQARVRPDEKPDAEMDARFRGSRKKLSSRGKHKSMMRGKKRSRRK